jgi:threonine/homoserine/homoserine lactone efflux protein
VFTAPVERDDGVVWSSLIAAVLVLALLTIVPGPDVAVMTRVALGSGRAAAARTAAGVAAGCLVWGVLTAAGLAAVLAASAEAYTVVKVVGAAYLVFLGAQALWRSRGRATSESVEVAPRREGRPFWTGLMTNLLNPKIAVFYTGLLPQLVPAGAPVGATLLGLVVAHAVLGLVWLNAYAALLHGARGTVTRPRVRRGMERITGVVLIGFGVRVATQHG